MGMLNMQTAALEVGEHHLCVCGSILSWSLLLAPLWTGSHLCLPSLSHL